MKNEILATIIQALIIVILPILAGYLGGFLKALGQKAIEQTKSATAKKYLGRAMDAVAQAVAATTQSYVDTLKKNKQFDIENQKEDN